MTRVAKQFLGKAPRDFQLLVDQVSNPLLLDKSRTERGPAFFVHAQQAALHKAANLLGVPFRS